MRIVEALESFKASFRDSSIYSEQAEDGFMLVRQRTERAMLFLDNPLVFTQEVLELFICQFSIFFDICNLPGGYERNIIKVFLRSLSLRFSSTYLHTILS